mgnify:CR=1 FL=1
MISQDIEFFKLKEYINDLDKKIFLSDEITREFLSSLIKQFDKVDLYYLNEYNQLQEKEYDRSKLRYELNFIYSIIEDFEELKSTMDIITEYQNSIINKILNKLTDIKDIVDMEPEDN